MNKTTKKPHDKWGRMQREVLKHIKGNDLRVYVDLLTYANEDAKCWPSVATIAKDIGMTARNVQKHLANLEKEGWIYKQFRTNTSTEYQLYFVDTSATPKKTAKNPASRMSKPDRSEASRKDRRGTSKSDVAGVSKSDVLTDHITNQKNRQQEQTRLDVVDGFKKGSSSYELTTEQQATFDKMWEEHGKEDEHKASAISAWKKYCNYGDKDMQRWLSGHLDYRDSSYMTHQMKKIYERYMIHKKREDRIAEKKANGTYISL